MATNEVFSKAVSLALENAPEDWLEVKVRYRYFDSAMDIATYYRNSTNGSWITFDVGSFDLMDFFNDYRNEVHPELSNPWSVIILTIDKQQILNVKYEYGDPNLLSR